MPMFKRPDGTLATNVPPYRRIMPFILKTRNESAVYFEQELDLTKTLEFIEQYNANHARRITVFHLFLWASMRSLHQRPGMNRFTVGGRIYQRNGIWLSYAAKKEMKDGSPLVLLKREFDPAMSFDQLVDFVHGDVKVGRSDQQLHNEKETNLSLKLPALLLRFGLWAIALLDSMNLLPHGFIKPDPMYASMMVTNLGSLKLESAYHHLYEYGNVPVFVALGCNKTKVDVDENGQFIAKTVCSVKYSFDERIEDGLYCAKTLEILRSYVEDPVGRGAAQGGPQPVALAA
jgi:hypothetical protein